MCERAKTSRSEGGEEKRPKGREGGRRERVTNKSYNSNEQQAMCGGTSNPVTTGREGESKEKHIKVEPWSPSFPLHTPVQLTFVRAALRYRGQ